MKFKLLFLFIILLSGGVLASTESRLINLDLSNDNLTMTIDTNFWWFNISGDTLDVNINYTFDVSDNIISNCSEWLNFGWDDCKNNNDDLTSINLRIEKQLAGCEEPKSDAIGNPKCWEQKLLFDNKTTDYDTCKTNLASEKNLKANLETEISRCDRDKIDMYDKGNVHILGVVIAIVAAVMIIKKKGKIIDQGQVEKSKSSTNYDGIDKQKMDEEMRSGKVM